MSRNVRGSSSARRVLGVAGVLGALAAGALITAPAASAAPAEVTLNYSCDFPLGVAQVGVVISAVLPDTAVVGTPVTVDGFEAVVTIPESAYGPVRLLGAASIDGTAQAAALVTDGAGTAQTVPTDVLTVPRTPLPASGNLVVTASGDVPAVTVAAAGTATVAVTESFTARLTPRTSSGGSTLLGTFNAPCTLLAGQNPTLGTVAVTAPA